MDAFEQRLDVFRFLYSRALDRVGAYRPIEIVVMWEFCLQAQGTQWFNWSERYVLCHTLRKIEPADADESDWRNVKAFADRNFCYAVQTVKPNGQPTDRTVALVFYEDDEPGETSAEYVVKGHYIMPYPKVMNAPVECGPGFSPAIFDSM